MLDIRQGDCHEVMAQMESGCVDAIVTDPPYGLSFMGKDWDHGVPGIPFWAEALRVAKPGAHLLAFGGTRTYHRLACAIEDAGWEVRDCLMWLYGSGFPKSLDVSKAIDKAAGQPRAREVKPSRGSAVRGVAYAGDKWTAENFASRRVDDPNTAPAAEWAGWGTALKPAWEPIILARKPLAGTVAANVQEYGTGALNVDGCRIAGANPSIERRATAVRTGWDNRGGEIITDRRSPEAYRAVHPGEALGRWPANVCLDVEAAAMLDEESGELMSGALDRGGIKAQNRIFGKAPKERTGNYESNAGGASRFFYTAKAASSERHYAGKNIHPCVKPVDLMGWLCRLVTPPGGLILDPFCGSGSTGIAALAEGFRFVGIELDPTYVELARKRIAGPLFAEAQP